MEITHKRKADEDQQEQPEKKSRNEQEERGTKRSTDDWEAFTKDFESRCRAESGREKQGQG